ncbi:MAG: NAD-dependent epimerase/dehydratase family protein [Betaproteobacteria bacterium]
MRVAVTGASGFIGQALRAALSAGGHDAVPCDLRAGVALGAADAVVHLAGIAHRGGVAEADYQRVNVDLAREVGRAAAASGMRMIQLSSVKVHGDESPVPLTEPSPLAPADAYARSKVRAEEALRSVAGLELAVLRPPLVYGPGVKANFRALLRAISSGVPLPLAGIENRRSFVYVGNLCDAVLRLLQAPRTGTYLVSDGVALSTPELCARLAAALGRRARLFAFPQALIPSALTRSLEVDDRALRAELGWRPPFSVDQGLGATVQAKP